MPKIYVTDSNQETKEIDFEEGYTLMEVLRDADYEEVQALCGGCCSCATCHVHIASEQAANLVEPEEDEVMLIEYENDYDADRSRLSCQIELTNAHDGLEVNLISMN